MWGRELIVNFRLFLILIFFFFWVIFLLKMKIVCVLYLIFDIKCVVVIFLLMFLCIFFFIWFKLSVLNFDVFLYLRVMWVCFLEDFLFRMKFLILDGLISLVIKFSFRLELMFSIVIFFLKLLFVKMLYLDCGEVWDMDEFLIMLDFYNVGFRMRWWFWLL